MKTALDELTQLLGDGYTPKTLDAVHDTLKLLGIVLSQMALLQVITDPEADNKDIVAASKTLLSHKEDPENIVERLKRSPFAGLSVEQLQTIVHEVKLGGGNLTSLLGKLKTQEVGPHSE